MAILALDLATVTGWALDSDFGLTSGAWDLSPGRGRLYQSRGLNLWEALRAIGEAHEVSVVAFEEVIAHPRPARMVGGKRHAAGTNVYAAHLFGALKEFAAAWAETQGARFEGIAVGTVKKIATGKGNARKEQMLAAAERKWPEQRVRSHDQADALFVLHAFRVLHA